MTLTAGKQLGPYEILAPLGAGGMGEVYAARDTRLGRTVAIKVLPSHLSSDPGACERFEREARAISSLNHPNICTLYDIGHQDGVHFLVLEHLEGDTLAKRLASGALPLDQVLRIAAEIADALDKAHRQEIFHRDLKPGNIMVTKSGAKLLDFGLAKVGNPARGAPDSELSSLPTVRGDLTAEGTILGTFQYMAPEQLEGNEADARSDVFALGAVVYEMATGRKAFGGKSQASLIASILQREPPSISSIQPMAPPALDRLVQTCLAKDPDERWQTAHDVMLQLRWIAEAGSQAGAPAPVVRRRRSRERLAWWLAGLAGAVAVVAVAAVAMIPSQEARPLEFIVVPPAEADDFTFSGIDASSLSVSPDGRYMTFAASTAEGKQVLWLRSLDSVEARPLPGTEGAKHPFWSPDSRFMAFFVDAKLKKIDLAGSPPLTLCDAPNGRAGSWNREGVIVFSPDTLEPIHQVPAGGGDATPVTALDEALGETTHRWASFLPDGHHFVFMAASHRTTIEAETNAIFLGDLESGRSRLLLHARSNVSYASGHLLYVRDRVLLAHAFDPDQLEFTGDPFPIAEGIQYDIGFFRGVFSVSENGVLAYRVGEGNPLAVLTWVGRDGKEARSFGDPGDYADLQFSPDTTQLALAVGDPDSGTSDLWIYDLKRDVPTRFTFGAQNEASPVWSPDGSRIAYQGTNKIWPDLWVKPASGAGEAEPLLESETFTNPTDWSPDGRYLAFNRFKPPGNSDLWILPMEGDEEPFPFLETEFATANAQFSPDGRWIAYVSDESGNDEIYVAPFPGPGGKWQVSKGGGFGYPAWSRDGTELVYLSGGSVVAVDVTVQGSRLRTGKPVELFPLGRAVDGTMAPDGERAILALTPEERRSEPVTVVVNWTAGLEH
ncbi:MAG: protein kinase [Chloroflexi bacterium]|nr:protein kinase [Chloroflexota bacterium]